MCGFQVVLLVPLPVVCVGDMISVRISEGFGVILGVQRLVAKLVLVCPE